MTVTIETSNADAVKFFQASYANELFNRLCIAAEQGDLSKIVNSDDFIEGDVLNGCAQTADSLTRQEFAWRCDRQELDEALNDPEIITSDTIDFAGIIAEARTITPKTQYDVIELGSQREVLIGTVFAADAEEAAYLAEQEYGEDGNRTVRVEVAR